MASILNNKLSKNAEVYLNGCNTANTDDNISQILSSQLPGRTVYGNRGYSLSTDEFYGKHWGGDFRFGVRKGYKNGTVVNEWDNYLKW